MRYEYNIPKYEYTVEYIGEFGRHLATYTAYDLEDLAEQFFKQHKHVDYKIISEDKIISKDKHEIFTTNPFTGQTYYHGFFA